MSETFDIIETINSTRANGQSLKYQRYTQSGCKGRLSTVLWVSIKARKLRDS